MTVGLDAVAVLHKGAVIKCSGYFCNETIGVLSEDLKPGDNRLSIEKNTGQGTRIDKLPRCKSCNNLYVVSETDMMRVHTARGWFPTEPQMMDALTNII